MHSQPTAGTAVMPNIPLTLLHGQLLNWFKSKSKRVAII